MTEPTTAAQITCADAEILEEIEAAGYAVAKARTDPLRLPDWRRRPHPGSSNWSIHAELLAFEPTP